MNALLLAVLLAAAAPEAVTAPITQADLKLQRLDDFEYAEAWYLVAEFEGHGRLFLVYSVTNTGLRPFTATIQASLLLPDGRIEAEKITVARKDITTSTGPFGMHFGAGQSLSVALEQSRFHFRGERIRVDVALKTGVKGYKFGDGKTVVGQEGRFFSYGVVTPRGRLSGEAVIGDTSVALNGFGYLDHTRQNIGAHKFIDRVFSFRSFSADESVNFFAFIDDGKVKMGGLSVTRGDRVLLATNQIAVQEIALRPTKTGPRYAMPGSLKVLPLAAELTLSQLVQEKDLLDDLNFFERRFIKLLVAQPMLYRYWAGYEIPLPDGTIAKGIGLAEAVIVRE